MKYSKTLLTLSLSLACMFSTPFAAFGQGQAHGVILGNNVNIRQAPKTEGKILTKLGIGQEVNVLSNDSNWYLIETNSKDQGWILNDLIAVDENNDFIKKGTTIADTLNIRKEPNTNSDIISTLPKKAEVTIVKTQDDWYEISVGKDKKGWIHKDYVKLKPNYSKGKIIGDNVNLRKEKSLDSEILATLNLDTTTYIKDYSDGWYNILTFKGEEGWIHKDYISIIYGDNLANTVSRGTNRVSVRLVQEAKKLLGRPYVYGANGPKSFDCSGFTRYVYKQCGMKLPRTSKEQGKTGKKVSKGNLQVGDLVFFDTSGKNNGVITHVGMYIGNGQFIHASSAKKAKKVVTSPINTGYYNQKYVTARRIY